MRTPAICIDPAVGRGRSLDLHAQARLGALGAQLVDAAGRHEAPAVDDRHAIADALDELELVGGEDDGDAGTRALGEHLGHDVGADRVQAGERLVEDQDRRVVDERGGELDALLIAQRQLLDVLRRALGDAEAVDPAGGGRVGIVAAVQGREVAKQAVDAHLRIQAALLGHVAERPLHLAGDRLAAPAHVAGVGLQHAERDPHRRRLAGTVGADEADDLALGDVERQAVERDRLSVASRHVAQLQHCGGSPLFDCRRTEA